MRNKDALTRKYLSQNDIFADAFNYCLFNGSEVIRPEDLREQDPVELAVTNKPGHTFTDQKIRDVLKLGSIKSFRHTTLALLGIEAQAAVHYAMPVRTFLYDALNYAEQVEAARKRHLQEKDTRTGAEFLSGFTKEDRLIPVITLCICFDRSAWDAPRSLMSMFRDPDPRIRPFINDYRLNLIIADEIADFSRFRSELGIVLEFIQKSGDKKKLGAIINSQEKYESVDIDTINMIRAYTAVDISVDAAEGGQINMRTAWDELKEDWRIEGLTEGRTQGRAEGASMLANLLLKLSPDSEDYNTALHGTAADRERLYAKYGIGSEL